MRHLARLFEVDEVVILDLAALPRRSSDSFVSRNRIFDPRPGLPVWLSVPLLRNDGQVVRESCLNKTNIRWREKHVGRICGCYPNHAAIAPGFVEAIEKALRKENETILDVNVAVLTEILESLSMKKPSITFESNILQNHSAEHRLEIALSRDAKTYVAGAVEWDLMKSTGQLSIFEQAGISVVRTPELNNDAYCSDITVKYSSVHAILSFGYNYTQQLLLNMVKDLRTAARA